MLNLTDIVRQIQHFDAWSGTFFPLHASKCWICGTFFSPVWVDRLLCRGRGQSTCAVPLTLKKLRSSLATFSRWKKNSLKQRVRPPRSGILCYVAYFLIWFAFLFFTVIILLRKKNYNENASCSSRDSSFFPRHAPPTIGNPGKSVRQPQHGFHGPRPNERRSRPWRLFRRRAVDARPRRPYSTDMFLSFAEIAGSLSPARQRHHSATRLRLRFITARLL